MSDANPVEPRKTDGWLEPGATNVQVIYVLYLVGLVIGISALVGVVMAYVNRGRSAPWIETHYTWLIRTFWIALLYGIISVFLMFLVIGFITALATVVLVIARCVIGLQAVSRSEPIKKPESWLI